MSETAHSKPGHLQDKIAERQIRHARSQFIDSINPEDVRRLAASYHPSQSNGEFFQEPIHGSYNICYFIQFPSLSGSSSSPRLWDKWVVRIPLAPCLPFGADQKLECEIATMKLVAQKTSIPIPDLIAYAINEKSKPFPTFMILEFVEAENLSHKKYHAFTREQQQQLYQSLADIFIQLRRLEFDAIGRLTCRDDASFTVSHPIATIDINSQALEGVRPSKVLARYDGGGPLQRSTQYIELLHDLADNAFSESRTSVLDNDGIGEEYLYYLHSFRSHVNKWRAGDDDRGPFVLVHGDFQPFNLLVNDQGSVVSVLDWEWSRVVPRQFFRPPLWLQYADTTLLSRPLFYERFLETLQDFLSIVRQREIQKYGSTMLADEWSHAQKRQGFLVSNALESWSHVDWYMSNQECAEGLEGRIQAFMSSDPRRADLVARKVRDGETYKADVQRNTRTKPGASRWFPASVCKLVSQAWYSAMVIRKKSSVPLLLPGVIIMFICGGGLVGYKSRLWPWFHVSLSRFC
ncbi:hypothetical protein FOVSG1_015101 [Fusarium oxysporum f. sp. vasinfectum]